MFLAQPAARRRVARLVSSSCAIATLAACGGGGGDSTPPPPPAPTPVIALNPTTVTVGGQAGQAPTSTTTQVAVANGVTGALANLAVGTITYSSGASNWLTATLAGTAAPTQLNLAANWAGIAAGTYTATVPVTSSTAGVAAQNVTVTLTVTAPPAIRLVPDNVSFTATAGGASPATQSLTIQNSGGGSLTGLAIGTVTYTGGSGVTGWLTPRLGGTTAPAALAFDASVAGLAPGTYTAQVPVTATAAGTSNSPQTANVTFTVSAPPSAIAFQPSGTLTFTAPAGGASPADQSVRITNSNPFGAAITGLAAGTPAYGAGATGWLAVRRAPGAATPDSIRIGIGTVSTLAAGTYTATLPVTGTAPGTGAVTGTIAVNLVIGAATPPRIDIAIPGNPADGVVVLAMNQGGALPVPVAVSITNGGTQPLTGLDFVIVDPLGAQWLAPQLSASGNGATLTVQANAQAQALPRGSRTATIRVRSTATGVTNSPIDIPVRLEVR